MNLSNYNGVDEFWNNELLIDNDYKNELIIDDEYENSDYSLFSSNSQYSNGLGYSSCISDNSTNSTNSTNPTNHSVNHLLKLSKMDMLDELDINYSRTKSDNDFIELELFESRIPKELSKEKKMSLLIVVLLQMIFPNNNSKLEKIYDFLNKKNILDLDVTKKKYFGLRHSLSMLVGSINNLNNLNNTNNTNENDMNVDFVKKNNQDKISVQNYANKYRTNFNQIKLLGQGSYGSVYKVFHKFEKKFYAIKKIFITNEIIEAGYNIFREIQIYSELNHVNIVRYYSSWVDIDHESILEYNNQIDHLNIDEFEPINYICPILFIQMELCDFTLKDYLLTYSPTDPVKTKIDLVLQIVNGLEYLKNKNIIHRDIKPDNIFLISDNTYPNKYIVKLGDFGLCKKYLNPKLINSSTNSQLKITKNLVCSNNISEIGQLMSDNNIDNKLIDKNELERKSNSLTTYIGTGIYRAPEIKTGHYDYKIDIYSLGIIILELFINFTTQSEKIFTIGKIIKNNTSFLLKLLDNKNIISIIIDCLNNLPEKRLDLDFIKKSFEEFV